MTVEDEPGTTELADDGAEVADEAQDVSAGTPGDEMAGDGTRGRLAVLRSYVFWVAAAVVALAVAVGVVLRVHY